MYEKLCILMIVHFYLFVFVLFACELSITTVHYCAFLFYVLNKFVAIASYSHKFLIEQTSYAVHTMS